MNVCGYDAKNLGGFVMSRMTAEQMLKMPRSDYMCKAQLEFFEAILQEQRQQLEQTLKVERSQIFDAKNRPADALDVAVVAEERRMKLRSIERKNNMLKKVIKSLAQLNNSSESNPDYGYCDITGEPIGLERLLTRPTATLSVEAKESQEKFESIGDG